MIGRMIEPNRRNILFITGTGTGVGKTIVTAAVAALARAAGQRVAVVKLAQTGVHNGPGSDQPDLETVTRLSGVTDTHELARFPDPLSPEAAARVSGLPPVDLEARRRVHREARGLRRPRPRRGRGRPPRPLRPGGRHDS